MDRKIYFYAPEDICTWTLHLFLKAHNFPQVFLSEHCLLLKTA